MADVCDTDASGFLQLPRGSHANATAPSGVGMATSRENRPINATMGMGQMSLSEPIISPAEPSIWGSPSNMTQKQVMDWPGAVQSPSELAQPQAMFCLATAISSLVVVGELAPSLGIANTRFVSCLLAAASLVGANLVANANLHAGVGVLDLIYARFVMLAFAGVALVRLHPEKPMSLPSTAEQAIQVLLGAFSLSASAMLFCGGVCLAPGTFVFLAIATLSGFGTLLKQGIMKEQVDWEESLCSVGLFLSLLPVLAAASHMGSAPDAAGDLRQKSPHSLLLGTILGLLCAVFLAASSLCQRNLAGSVHHTVLLTWSGGVGLIMFSPVALIFPEEARVLWTLDWSHFASLLLFASLSFSYSALLVKTANASFGLSAELSYLLVGGLSAGLQYVADVAFLQENLAILVQTSLALMATFVTFSYIISCRQLIRLEECMSMAGNLHFEPQRFSQRLARQTDEEGPWLAQSAS